MKDLDVNEPILTSNRGWAKHGELVVGDYVFPEGKPPSRFLQQVRDILNRASKFTFLDGAEIVSGKTHLWRSES